MLLTETESKVLRYLRNPFEMFREKTLDRALHEKSEQIMQEIKYSKDNTYF